MARCGIAVPVILLATLTSLMTGVFTVSQFESDAAFSIIDTNLNSSGLNELSGFDVPPPVLLRGENGLNATTGIFNIMDDGFYVFIIHWANWVNASVLPELRVNRANSTNSTLANLVDTVHIIAELKRGDDVLITVPNVTQVIGDQNNPFIYNAFLLYHTSITSFPRVRQSAFTVSVMGNLSVANTFFTDYNVSSADIGPDFNQQEGIFLVPMKGIYVFHLSATFTNPMSGASAIALTVNNAEKGRVQALFNGGTSEQNAAITVSLPLHQDNKVQLKNINSTPSSRCVAVFTGYLLS